MEPVMHFLSAEHKQNRQKAVLRVRVLRKQRCAGPTPAFGIGVISCISRWGLLESCASLHCGPYSTDPYEASHPAKSSLEYTRGARGSRAPIALSNEPDLQQTTQCDSLFLESEERLCPWALLLI